MVGDEFISRNGIKMIEGYQFNWKKSNIYVDDGEDPYNKGSFPWVFSMSFGSMSDMWICNYYTENSKCGLESKKDMTGILTIFSMGDSGGLEFKVPGLNAAEIICQSVILAKNYEISPLFQKDPDEVKKPFQKYLKI